jgi:putative addiction module component (TIGR02574 family)
MSSALERLKEEAMSLPPRSRARLAERLIASLDQGPSDPDAEELWAAEAQQRGEELASGKVEGIPAETVLAKARARLR